MIWERGLVLPTYRHPRVYSLFLFSNFESSTRLYKMSDISSLFQNSALLVLSRDKNEFNITSGIFVSFQDCVSPCSWRSQSSFQIWPQAKVSLFRSSIYIVFSNNPLHSALQLTIMKYTMIDSFLWLVEGSAMPSHQQYLFHWSSLGCLKGWYSVPHW